MQSSLKRAADEALDKAAFEITRELICCDIYERLWPKVEAGEALTTKERQERRSHTICWWGSAARAIVLDVKTGER